MSFCNNVLRNETLLWLINTIPKSILGRSLLKYPMLLQLRSWIVLHSHIQSHNMLLGNKEIPPSSLFYTLSSVSGWPALIQTQTKTKMETQSLEMNVDMLLIEPSEPSDKQMEPVQGDNGRRNYLEYVFGWHHRAILLVNQFWQLTWHSC